MIQASEPEVWVPDFLRKSIEKEFSKPATPAPNYRGDQRIWSDLDYPKRNRKPFIPRAGDTEPKNVEEQIKGLASFEEMFSGLTGEARAVPILKSMGMTEEHLNSYPTLDPSDPHFWDTFSFEKFMTDPRYAIESFMEIDSKEGGVVPFKLNPVQLAFLFNRTGRDIALKGRQHGLTTLILALYLWDTMLNPARMTVIMTHEKEASQQLLARAKMMYDSIPHFLKPPLKHDTKDRMEFEGMQGSQIIIQVIKKSAKTAEKRNKSGGTGRSKKINNLLLSEPAFYEGVEDKDLLGLMEAVPVGDGGSITIESTPNGVGGFFFKECEAAKRMETNKKLFILPWTLNPRYDDNWKKEKQKERHLNPRDEEGRRNWGQEYECDFLQSQSSFFPVAICEPTSIWQERLPYLVLPSKKKIKYPPHIHIFQEPNPREIYVMGVDCAQGLDHGDYSSATIISRKTRCEVAQIYDKIKPEQFTELVRWAGRKYNYAFVGVENEGNGMVVLHGLMRDLDHEGNEVEPYENLFFYRNEYSTRQGGEGQPGWNTNKKTRPVMLSELKKSLQEDSTHLAFKKRSQEMKMFTIIDGKPQAPPGENDDLIISAAIANRLLDFPEAIRRTKDVDLEVRMYGS